MYFELTDAYEKLTRQDLHVKITFLFLGEFLAISQIVWAAIFAIGCVIMIPVYFLVKYILKQVSNLNVLTRAFHLYLL